MTYAQCMQWMYNAGFTCGRITWEGDPTSLSVIVALAQAMIADGRNLKLFVTLDISTLDINNGNVTFTTEALAYAYGHNAGQSVATALAPYSACIIALATGNELSGKDNIRLNASTQGMTESDFNNAKFPALRGILGGCQDGINVGAPGMPVFSNAFINAELALAQMLYDGRQPDGTSGYRRIIPDGFDWHTYQIWGNLFCISNNNGGWLPFINLIEQIGTRFNGKPVYLSEFNSDAGDGDVVMANWVQKRVQDVYNKRFDLNIAGYAYYAMIDTSGNVWGCLENNGTLRVTRGQTLARQIKQSPDVDAASVTAKAFEVMAKYAGNVRLYLPSWSFTDTGGTAAPANGSQLPLLAEVFGTPSANGIPSPQGTGNPTYVSADNSIAFTTATKPFLMNTPFMTTTEDFAVVVGAAPSGAGNSAGMAIVAMSAKQAASTYARIGCIFVKPTQVVAEWYADTGADFQATWAIPGGTYNAPRVLTSRKSGNTGSVRVNGAQQGTVDLTTFSTFTATNGWIGQEFLNDAAQYAGNLYGVVAVKGAITDAEVLILERWMNTLTPTGVTF